MLATGKGCGLFRILDLSVFFFFSLSLRDGSILCRLFPNLGWDLGLNCVSSRGFFNLLLIERGVPRSDGIPQRTP